MYAVFTEDAVTCSRTKLSRRVRRIDTAIRHALETRVSGTILIYRVNGHNMPVERYLERRRGKMVRAGFPQL